MKERNRELLEKLSRQANYHRPEYFQKIVDRWVSLLRKVPVPHESSVVDLAPGMSPKIMFVMDEIGVTRELTIMDIDSRALSIQRYVASLLKPAFSIEYHETDIFNESFSKYGLVIGNHIVDDLIAEMVSRKQGSAYSHIFSNAELQLQFWDEVEKNHTDTSRDVLTLLTERLSEVDIDSIIALNNYPAYFDQRFEIRTRTRFINAQLDHLKETLLRANFIHIPSGNDVNGETWLIMRKV